MSLLLCLFSVSLGRYCRKNLAKSGGFEKKISRGWPYGRLPIEGGSSLLHTMAKTKKIVFVKGIKQLTLALQKL